MITIYLFLLLKPRRAFGEPALTDIVKVKLAFKFLI